jgi:hypothetical protein
METKQWYQSSTIQSAVVIIVIVLFQMLFGGDDTGQTIDTITRTATENKDLITQIMTLAAGGLVIRGRVKANTSIVKKDGKNNE